MSSSTADEFRSTLAAWGRRRRTDRAARDPMIRAALAAGITREDIHILTGVGRTTIDRIVRAAEDAEDARRVPGGAEAGHQPEETPAEAIRRGAHQIADARRRDHG